MTDDKMTADRATTLAIRARILALLGDYQRTKPGEGKARRGMARVARIRRRIAKLHNGRRNIA